MSDHAGNTGESTMKYEDPIVIVGAKRTPMGAFQGALSIKLFCQ